MSEKDYTYDYISDQLDAVIDRELDATRTSITRAEIKEIVENVLWRCGIHVGGKDMVIKHQGVIDRYHRGLFVAVKELDKDGVHLYPLRPGQTVDILMEPGGWETVRVESNPAAEHDPQALRVRLDVGEMTPVVGAAARMSSLLEAKRRQQPPETPVVSALARRAVPLDMRPRAEIEAAKAAEISEIEGAVKELEYKTDGDS